MREKFAWEIAAEKRDAERAARLAFNRRELARVSPPVDDVGGWDDGDLEAEELGEPFNDGMEQD